MVNQLIEQALEQGKIQAAVPGPGHEQSERESEAPECVDYLLAREDGRRRWPPILVRVREDGRLSVAMTFDPETGRYVELSAREAARLAGISVEDVDLLTEETVDRRFEDLAVETILDEGLDRELVELLQEGESG